MNDSQPTTAEETKLREDTLTHDSAAHAMAAGVGAAGGGAAGAAIGLVVAGPVGGVIGAVIGAVAGGLSGNAVGETLDPTTEEAPPAVAEAEPVPWHEMTPSGLPSYEEIAQRAWSYYEAEGRPEGQDVRHWLAAEASLHEEASHGGSMAA